MKHLSLILYSLTFCFFSCKKDSSTKLVVTSTTPIKSVLILGNSIVRHPVNPGLGWYGDWGMAASSIDSDFVHILMRDIHQKDTSAVVRFLNIADFETGYTTYPLSNLDSLKNPDMLILRISENVDDNAAVGNNFYSHYASLVSYLTPKKEQVKVIVDGFWPKAYVNDIIKTYAKDSSYPYVENRDLFSDATNQAGSQFANPGVAIHPSDKGMRMIAGRIWDVIEPYFK